MGCDHSLELSWNEDRKDVTFVCVEQKIEKEIQTIEQMKSKVFELAAWPEQNNFNKLRIKRMK